MNAPYTIRINPTRVRRFGRCEYEWYCRDVLGVRPVQPPPSPHRDRGKAFHALLEHALRLHADSDGDSAPFTYAGDAGKQAARAVLVDLYQAEGMSLGEKDSYALLDAVRYHLVRLDLTQWEVVRLADGTPLIEADLCAPLTADVQAQARIDVVLRRRSTGKVWLVDFKSTSFPIRVRDLTPWVEHDDQLALGRYVLVENGVDVDYAALLHLRSKAPTPPPLVYVGKPRERTTRNVNDLACDWETYRTTLVERGEDPHSEEALKVRDALREQVFARWQPDITHSAGQAATAANLRRIAERMLALADPDRDDAPIRRLSQGRHRAACERCDYGAWCRAALRNGGKPDLLLLGTDYETFDWSQLSGQETYDAPLFDPAQAYVAWAAEQGRNLEPHEEFTP